MILVNYELSESYLSDLFGHKNNVLITLNQEKTF